MPISISKSRFTQTSREKLLARLADAAKWPEWSPFQRSEIVRPGPDGPGTPGEIRWFYTRTARSREEVLPSEGDVVLRYRMLKGLPLKNYVAEVRIVEAGDGREVIWSARFDPEVPFTGWIYRMALKRFFVQLLETLVAD